MRTRLAAIPLLLAALVLGVTASSSAREDPPIANASEPEEGVLFGGQPSEEQLAALAEAGYTILDLRMPQEDRGYDEVALAKKLGVEYHNLPVGAGTLGEAATYERFFELFEDAERPVAVHCASGNRVGGLYYAYLVARRGVSREEALEKARANGLRSEGLREAIDGYLDSLP